MNLRVNYCVCIYLDRFTTDEVFFVGGGLFEGELKRGCGVITDGFGMLLGPKMLMSVSK